MVTDRGRADSAPGATLGEPDAGSPDPPATRYPAAFRRALLAWFEGVARDLPWREESDPYRIWLSEIMLQQTRVDQALPYFVRFVERFPNVETLAAANLDEVLLAWEGLGYYARARNMHRAAREVVDRFGGVFPPDIQDLRSLPGIGEYTAAAVGSLAFGIAAAAVDGNVERVVARLLADDGILTRAATRRRIREAAGALLDPVRPGIHNEAMMELGATICTPRSPACPACPVRTFCMAATTSDPASFPVRAARRVVPHYDIAVGIIRDDSGRVLIQQRPEDAMLGGLWEFPGGKCEPGERPDDACRRELTEELGVEVAVGPRVAEIDHAYSHFRITLHAFPCRIVRGEPVATDGQTTAWVATNDLAGYAFPRANRRLIDGLRKSDDR